MLDKDWLASQNDNEPLTAFVMHGLQHHPRQDLLLELCERTGMSWQEAERFVGQVEAEHQIELEGSSTRLRLVVSFIMVTDGLVGMGIGFAALSPQLIQYDINTPFGMLQILLNNGQALGYGFYFFLGGLVMFIAGLVSLGAYTWKILRQVQQVL